MQKNQIIEIKMMVKKDKINKAHIKKIWALFFCKKIKKTLQKVLHFII